MASEYNRVLAEVRNALGGVTGEAVRQRRAKIQNVVSMPNDVALYVLAQQLNLPLHRWVTDAERLAQVAYFAGQVADRQTPLAAPQQTRKAQTERSGSAATTELRLDNVSIPPGLLTQKHIREAERMSKRVYPLLYVFENSIREFIDGHLTAAYGKGWWDDATLNLVSVGVRRNAATAKSAEVSRNIVAHMNPLQPRDIQSLEISVQSWFKQVAHDPPPAIP